MVQRGRGPSGRVVSKRGRIRNRGPSGGGTLRRKSPQEGQRPSLATGPATSALSQCPRASHSGLMHCTVKPGRYCIASPQGPQGPLPWRSRAGARSGRAPGCPPRSRRRTLRARIPYLWSRTRGRAGTAHSTAHSALSHRWCQAENTARYCGEVAAVKNLVSSSKILRQNTRIGAAKILRRFSLTIRNSS